MYTRTFRLAHNLLEYHVHRWQMEGKLIRLALPHQSPAAYAANLLSAFVLVPVSNEEPVVLRVSTYLVSAVSTAQKNHLSVQKLRTMSCRLIQRVPLCQILHEGISSIAMKSNGLTKDAMAVSVLMKLFFVRSLSERSTPCY